MPPLVKYTVLRLLAFLVPLAILWLFPIFREFWWLAAIFAALIGASISLLFLRSPLSDASAELYQRRMQRNPGLDEADDAAAEDAFVDQQDRSAASADSAASESSPTPDEPGDSTPRA